MGTSNTDSTSNSNDDQQITTTAVVSSSSLLSTTSNTSLSLLSTNFEVYVSKDTFKFNAAHFVAYKGYRERLHGHNYQVSVRLFGHRTIGSDGYLIDFGNVKDVTKRICKQLNEYFLCPMLSTVLNITIQKDNNDGQEKSVHIQCEDGTEFVFPRNDVAMLPLVHATAEELAIYLYGEILNGLDAMYLLQRNIHTMEIIVAEAPGQQATFRLPIPTTKSQSTNTFQMDVCQFITDGDIIPMPCLNKDNNNNENDDDKKPSSTSKQPPIASAATAPVDHEVPGGTKVKHHQPVSTGSSGEVCPDCTPTKNNTTTTTTTKFSDKLRILLDSIHSGEVQEDEITSDDIKQFLL